MDQLLFLHREIRHVLESFNMKTEDRIKLLAVIDNLNTEKLFDLLKILYKIEREYFQMMYDEVQETEEFIKTLNSIND